VNYSNYTRTIEGFIKTHLKELQIKNREAGESNNKIVAAYNLQCYLYNVGKPIGGKQGEKRLIYDFVKNQYMYKKMAKSIQCFSNFYKYSH
jgi:hypothetical protein